MQDYSKKLEETLQEAGIVKPRPSVLAQAVPPSSSRPEERARATFSTVMAAQAELHKRLQTVIEKALELETRLHGPVNEAAMPNTGEQPQADPSMPVFGQLATQTLIHAKELARLDRILDRALGVLR